MRNDYDKRDEQTHSHDDEPTSVIAPARDGLPHPRSAADDETRAFDSPGFRASPFESPADSSPFHERVDTRDDADARDADVRDADVQDADARDADVRDADARDADVRDADARDADARDADARDADARDGDGREGDPWRADTDGDRAPVDSTVDRPADVDAADTADEPAVGQARVGDEARVDDTEGTWASEPTVVDDTAGEYRSSVAEESSTDEPAATDTDRAVVTSDEPPVVTADSAVVTDGSDRVDETVTADGSARVDETVTADGSDRVDDAVAADESERVDEAAADATTVDEPVAAEEAPELLPGAAAAVPVTGLWADGRSQEFRDRWRDVQLKFVDDPHAAAQEAESLVGDAVEAITNALAAQREELSGWQSAEKHDTEELRMAVRQYREFLDRILDL